MKMRSIVVAFALIASAAAIAEVGVSVDFGKVVAPFRPALHSAGFSPPYRNIPAEAGRIRDLGVEYVRTHDLALVNPGARIFDNHFIFPLANLDATKPENYYFAATDWMVKKQLDAGLKIFWRLGTSIEHTGTTHFNAEIPKDFDKIAESFAGTVRHYVRGWAGGMTNAVEYWEIWNEPDGKNNMWSFTGVDDNDPKANRNDERRDLFVKFFVTVLKRLRSEFGDTIKVGGPALCDMDESWFRPILRACKAAGVRPDFLSWHEYGIKPHRVIEQVEAAHRMCVEEGFPKMAFINNEYHYWPKRGWKYQGAKDSPAEFNDIDSAAYTLTVLSLLQTSRYSQAYFYGIGNRNYGYLDADTWLYNKNYYALMWFGELRRACRDICASTSTDLHVTPFAMKSADGRTAKLLVTDYCGTDANITVEVAGLGNVTNVNAEILSYTRHPGEMQIDLRDPEPFAVEYKDNKVKLEKPDRFSAAWMLTFEL